jgi:hypothetical protein
LRKPELSTIELGKYTGAQWKLLSESEQAKYTAYSKAQGEIIERGGVSITWPGPEAAAALPVGDLLNLWRANLAAMTHDRSRMSEWSQKQMREMLARFYGTELVDTHKEALKGLVKELVGTDASSSTPAAAGSLV